MWHSDAGAMIKQTPSPLIVLFSLFFAFALEFFPWSAALLDIKPVFPLLMLIYWVVHHPRLINYAAGVVIGVIIDLANQTPLGFNALACSLIVFLTNLFYARFVLLGGFGQMMQVVFILSIGQLSLYFLGFLEERRLLSALSWRFFTPSLSAGMLWLLIPLMARYFGRHGKN